MASRIHQQQKTVVTMRDVARAADVSQSTVSRVLSGTANGIPIGEETKERVLAAVKELGYYPNLHAGSLRGQKTQMLAIMIADLANAFYHPMVRAVQDVARAHQYDVLIANTDHTRDGELLFLESIIRRPVDGVIMVPYHLTDSDIDRLIVRTGAAVAVIGQHIQHPLVDIAFGDDYQATREAVAYLVEQRQHRRVGFIGVTDRFAAGARRRLAFLDGLKQAGLTAPPEYFALGDWSVESGRESMRVLLTLPNPPTAVFACNDLMAIGALQAAEQLGRRIPEDVAVIGFDDIPAASWVRPRLTTVTQHPGRMAQLLSEALFERFAKNELGPARRFEVPCGFVVRESA